MAKREGILSRWFRQRAEAEEKAEAAESQAAGSFGSETGPAATIEAAAKRPTKEELDSMEKELKEAELRKKMLAQKEKARREMEEALRKSEEAREKAKAKAEEFKRKEEAEKEMEALRRKLEQAKAEIAAERRKLKAEKQLEEMRQKIEAARAKIKADAAKRTYVVKSGDSLSAIAKKLLGDASLWPKIYEANKDVIGDNPNLIHPGQEYTIPDLD